MSRKAILPILLLVAAGAACDGDDEFGPDDREDVDGFWVGRTNGLETADDRVFELLLREDDDKKDDDNDNDNADEGTEIDGAGTIKGSNFSIAVLVEGVNVFPDVALTLISEDFSGGKQFINFRGEFVSEDVIRGKLNGGGFNDEPLRLRRTEAFVDP